MICYHCSTCIEYIYLYQNCTGSVVLISKSAQRCPYNPRKDRWNQHNTVCTILVKIDVLHTYGAIICSYFGIVFLLLFKKIENAVYTSFKNSILLFINGLIFDIMNIQNYQSLEFEWVPVKLHLLDLSIIEGFHGFVMFSLSLSKIGWILFSNTKETLQKMLARKCSYRYRGKHMKEWKQVLIIKSLKLPNFFFDIRLSMYWQNTFLKTLLKTGLVGKDL